MPSSAIVSVEERIVDVQMLGAVVRQLREHVFIDGQDYGTIPGTGDKPTLLLPGMEKLLRALRLRPEYVDRAVVRDYDKPLFSFEIECRLYEIDTNLCVSTAVGNANSYESKWRWREAKRACPKCGAAAINRSKYPPRNNPNAEPGWYCFAKQGGCGAEFAANDPAIIEQQTGRVENPDIFDQVNTILKIAQKRALASAIKGAANVSQFFTVDIEDLPRFTPPAITIQHQDIVDAEYVETPSGAVDKSTGVILGNDSAPRRVVGLDLEYVYQQTKRHFDNRFNFNAYLDDLKKRTGADEWDDLDNTKLANMIHDERLASGNANKGWYRDPETMRALNAALKARGTTLEKALARLDWTLSKVESAEAILAKYDEVAAQDAQLDTALGK